MNNLKTNGGNDTYYQPEGIRPSKEMLKRGRDAINEVRRTLHMIMYITFTKEHERIINALQHDDLQENMSKAVLRYIDEEKEG